MEYIVNELTKYNIYNFITVYSLIILVIVNFVVSFKKKDGLVLSLLTSMLGTLSFFFQSYYCGILIDNGIDVLYEFRLVIVFTLISVVICIVDIYLMITNKNK